MMDGRLIEIFYTASASCVIQTMIEFVLLLLLSIAVVFISALLFVNSIEFIGGKYNMGAREQAKEVLRELGYLGVLALLL